MTIHQIGCAITVIFLCIASSLVMRYLFRIIPPDKFVRSNNVAIEFESKGKRCPLKML